VLSPKNSSRGKLLNQYVRVRITRMDDVDIALFERDWNNTLYYFLMNADEQIYMRYGGRDARSPMTYLDLNSLEIALERGLELHQKYQKGELKKTERPAPFFPRQIPPLVERTFARNQCVECHLIGDFKLIHQEQTGTLNKLTDMYRWPDIRKIGIELDIPKGLVVKEARDTVQAAGMQPGDRIAALNGTPVWTFGDLQFYFDKVPRSAQNLQITVERAGKMVDLPVKLPERWWLTDLRFRQLSVDPRPEFESRPLTADEKRKYELKPDSFASEITRIGGFAEMLKVHELKAGDVVYAVDGVERDDVANTPDLFIKLRKNAGDTVTLDIIRDGKRMKMPVRTQRMYFRK
jgi:serine protease Do